jgi:hypothetical protein
MTGYVARPDVRDVRSGSKAPVRRPSLPLYGPLALIDSLAALILRFQVFLDEEAERPVE